jgi:REDY-like protein HapK
VRINIALCRQTGCYPQHHQSTKEATMAYLLIRYTLKDGIEPADFERWVRETDQPGMRGLARVKAFDTFRATGLLMGEGAPSQSYFEIFEIDDLAGFTTEDMPGAVVQAIMGEFMGFVENPEFTIAEKI